MSEYIDKAEAISRFSFYNVDRIPERDVDGFPNTITFHDAKMVVRSIRPADVRPVVHGHWVHLSGCDMCSKCGYHTGKHEQGKNFCPNCGADMRGE